MMGYAAKRILLALFMLFGLVCITFAVSNIAPTDPASLAAGPDATQDMIETVRKEYGLDRPLPQQFVRYVSDLAQGNLGRSVATSRMVRDELARFFPATLELVTLAMGIGVLLGVPLGMMAAVMRNGLADHGTRIFAISGVAMPAFWFGIVLQLFFGVYLELLPTSGRLPVTLPPPPTTTHFLILDAAIAGQWEVMREAIRHAILPALVLALPCLASIVRVHRSEMIEVLASDYITSARAHGIGRLRIVGALAFRNTLIPTLALIGLRYGWMLGGTVLVETVFDWPGIGLYAVQSAIASDFKPIMGVTLLIGLNFMIVNLLVDLAYSFVDPRVRAA
jgi:peptide/nickel transport system permease protein